MITKTYATNDGEKFKAKDHEDFYVQLKGSSFLSHLNDEDFMNRMAERATEQTGKVVHAGGIDQFVNGLLAAGLVKITED